MKKIWEMKWETIPGDGEQTVGYPSLERAISGIRQRILDTDLSEFSAAIQKGQNRKFRQKLAHFFDCVFTDPGFRQTAAEIPDDSETFDMDYFDLSLGEDFIDLKDGENGIIIKSNIASIPTADLYYDYLCFHIYFDDGEMHRVNELVITLRERVEWGNSANALLVLHTLESAHKPISQEMIVNDIAYAYETKLERKSVGRHIRLLRDLGYDIRHTRDGFYLQSRIPEEKKGDPQDPSEAQAPVQQTKWKSSAHPLLVLRILKTADHPLSPSEISGNSSVLLNAKISLKAVKRHIELLRELGYRIHCTNGKYKL